MTAGCKGYSEISRHGPDDTSGGSEHPHTHTHTNVPSPPPQSPQSPIHSPCPNPNPLPTRHFPTLPPHPNPHARILNIFIYNL